MSTGPQATAAPGWLRVIMLRVLPVERRAELLLEMDELYSRRLTQRGRLRADLWYLRHAIGFGAVRIGTAIRALIDGVISAFAILLRDTRLGARVLRRRPGYSLSSALTLGIGTGGVVAVFSVANWVLLRPVPGVPNADQLTTVRLQLRGADLSPAFPMSDLDLRSLEERIATIESLEAATYRDANVVWGAGIEPDRRSAAIVSGGFFELLGLQPAIGRLPDRDDSSGVPVALISHDMWQTHFAGAGSAIGSPIRINGTEFQVVGVAPDGFRGAELPGQVDMWVTSSVARVLEPRLSESFAAERGVSLWTDMIARTAVGADAALIRTEGDAAIQSIRDDFGYPNSFAADFELRPFPGLGLSPRVRAPVARTLSLLSAAAATLLLLAIANAANLALTHRSAQGSAIAVHTAMGASRRRLISQGLIEHALVGLLGTLVGLFVGLLGVSLFREGSISTIGASLDGLQLDAGVMTFAVIVAVSASVLAGIGPVVGASRVDISEALRGHKNTSRKTVAIQNLLVVLQVALSTVLLVSSGLLARTALNLRETELGFEPDRAVRFSLDPSVEEYSGDEVVTLAGEMVRRLEADPAVSRAGFVYPSPVQPRYLTAGYYPSGGDPEADVVRGGIFQATEGLFAALGSRLLAGRFPTDSEWSFDSATVVPVLITRSFAEGAFGTGVTSAVGQTLLRSFGNQTIKVVGVVENLRFASLSNEAPPLVFVPWGTSPVGTMTGWVRAANDPKTLPSRIRAISREVATGLPIFGLKTGRSQVDGLVVEERILARLGISLAVLGLLLAGIGLQGVLSYLVLQRRREIGIRIALGAPDGLIRRGITGRAMALTMVGLILGALATFPATGVIASRLHGVATLDPLTYSVVFTALLLTAYAAAAIPAWRSTRVDAREALSSE